MGLEILSPILIVAFALLFVGLERRFPYDRGQRLFRAGFWNDLGMYTILQSYLLSYLIFGLIGWIDDATSLSRLRIFSDWPIVWQAVQCYDSQTAYYGTLASLSPANHAGVWGWGTFYRVFSTVNGGRALEDDLFGGLRAPAS